ncbi:hypothetical protein IC757_06375 [Wenzhouxiangella sp. AB-CW3]|uniref:hypothetical protein n=1 Tax=Wenzhouxiangella sp. AB-CW3 TaxID=2771012 RepID=UPI00168B7E40|nr:hypothetical protein [Wenzhouxiangella sp. AB-CW3]QOC23749.1 hypothetical protein IC757_06375 [Wenzhouxiangella sp. AB-CW3]
MNRRRFLLISGSGLLVLGGGGLFWRFAREIPAALPGIHFDHIARDMTGVAVVGQAWLEQHDDTDPHQVLLDNLALSAEHEMEFSDLVATLGERIEHDLAGHGLFKHEGWWLSQTEAALAALHVKLLGEDASHPDEPGFEQAGEGRLLRIQGQAPTKLVPGEPLAHPGLPENVISFETAQRPPSRLVFFVQGHRLHISPRSNGFSVQLIDVILDDIARAGGSVALWLYDPVAQRRQQVGTLTVTEAVPDQAGFCAPADWGERETVAGEPFNEQPDGASAFWILVDCFPDDTVVVFDGVELPTTLQADEGLITARMPDPTLIEIPGEYALELLDRKSGAVEPVGQFRVREP